MELLDVCVSVSCLFFLSNTPDYCPPCAPEMGGARTLASVFEASCCGVTPTVLIMHTFLFPDFISIFKSCLRKSFIEFLRLTIESI